MCVHVCLHRSLYVHDYDIDYEKKQISKRDKPGNIQPKDDNFFLLYGS